MTPGGLYVHVPFCLTRCGYCDFNAYAGLGHLSDSYVEALIREADLAASDWRDVPFASVFFGGNFHTVFMVDPDSRAEIEEATELNRRMVERALRMDGTCTGEHGIGLGKRDFLRAEHGEAVEVMRAVKRALDPRNLLNPGKVV